MVKTTINLSPTLLAELDAIAVREGRSRAAVIRDALDEFSRARSRSLPEWVGMIDDDDGALTSTNVDSWLEEYRRRVR